MAINPNFVFSDPALQAQIVNAAQVRAAMEAARQQQFGETLRAQRAERQAALEREERRADRAADLRRLDATEAERRRQFDATQALQREGLASNEKIYGVGRKEADDKEAYSNLLSFIERTTDIPTASEWNARIVGLSPERQKLLNERRLERVNEAKLIAGEVGRLTAKIGKPDGKGGLFTPETARNSSPFRNSIGISPEGDSFMPLVRSREEAGLLESRSRRQAITEGIGDVLGRLGQSAATVGGESVARGVGLGGGVMDAIRGMAPTVLPMLSPMRFRNPPVESRPVQRPFVVPQPSPGFIPRETDFRVPVEYPGGPLIDADTGAVLDQNVLAPPVFVPPY